MKHIFCVAEFISMELGNLLPHIPITPISHQMHLWTPNKIHLPSVIGRNSNMHLAKSTSILLNRLQTIKQPTKILLIAPIKNITSHPKEIMLTPQSVNSNFTSFLKSVVAPPTFAARLKGPYEIHYSLRVFLLIR